MARPKSETKEEAILEAATAVFAQRGFWSTPTSAISRAAGVAEGTLFTYFKTKDDLLNGLYRSLKEEMAASLLEGLPLKADLESVLRHLWDRHFEWSLAHPAKYAVMGQLRVSESVTEETRRAGGRPFAAIETLIREAVRKGKLRPLPFDFIAALLTGLLDASIAQATAHPRSRSSIREQGFEVLWHGLGRT
jgi:AcrR family transcriptional regulator